MKHYKYGGSTAARTLACPNWIINSAGSPAQKTSTFAEEGTQQHDFMEEILLGGNPVINDFDQDERCSMALEAWDELCKNYKVVDYEPEQTFEMSPEMGGTADVIAWSEDRTLIVDWKFGQGILVEAIGSAQGMFYAMCAEHAGKLKGDLTIAIIQPINSRTDHETLKVWDVPKDVFELFKQQFSQAYRNQNNTTHAGNHCQWCPAAATCPEKSGEARKALMMSPALIPHLAENLARANELEGWIKEVKKVGHEQLELGNEIEGYKLVSKRATRHWVDDEGTLLANLKKQRKLKVAEILPSKLLSVAQMEKLFKQKGLDTETLTPYINKTSTGTTIAETDDPREAVLSPEALKAALVRIA